jgi:acetyltransferase-like isoleucine patch superfamily enzyme
VISQMSVVETNEVGENVEIREFAVVRKGAIIGSGVVIHPHVVVESGVIIGDEVEIFPGAYLGKEPKGAGALAREPRFERRTVIGNGSSIGPHAVIFYDVEIGEGTLIGDGVSIREQCRIGSKCVISRYVTLNYNCVIGDRTKIMDLSHITGNCCIGDDVFVSTCVATANDNAIGRLPYSDAMLGPTVESGAMIGLGARLLPGITVGEDSLVGAGAVVTADVEPHTVVMGIPARPVSRK